jgi:hypothetical protein
MRKKKKKKGCTRTQEAGERGETTVGTNLLKGVGGRRFGMSIGVIGLTDRDGVVLHVGDRNVGVAGERHK